jgi:hypothetical protein
VNHRPALGVRHPGTAVQGFVHLTGGREQANMTVLRFKAVSRCAPKIEQSFFGEDWFNIQAVLGSDSTLPF